MLSSANAASLTSVPSGLEESWVSAVSLTRRMPPRYIDRTVAGITHLCPRLKGEILTRVERKLKLCFDPEARRYFVACPYNQHGAAYRSPWTNKYIQAQGDTREVSPTPPPPALRRFKPADHLRRVECAYNQIFDAYRHTYYEGGVSSVYVWSLPSEDGFAAAFVIHHGEAPLCYYLKMCTYSRIYMHRCIRITQRYAY
ncbi:f-actin-capping protein subunit [Cystoisospora suis]|uniref:F-actin-capping protein subunit beta n=1 Tax=Cystoisospora suis TaxID=483139 RepID=A0A2C6K889_9APIC|nr:f-actin-capping protein subunit [Cystoisospora suis]